MRAEMLWDQRGDDMRYLFIKAENQSEGDLQLSDGANWATSKALIKTIRIVTTSTNWDLYILQNGNSYATDDANIPKMQIMEAGNGNLNIHLDLAYEDEDDSSEVHLYYVDNSGSNTATIYVIGVALNEISDLLPASTIAAASDIPAMVGTNNANTVIPDSKGTAAGLHSATDGKITSLNNITATQVVTALLGAAIDGAINFESLLQILSATFAGEMVESEDGNTVIYKNQAGDAKVTEDFSTDGVVDRVIA